MKNIMATTLNYTTYYVPVHTDRVQKLSRMDPFEDPSGPYFCRARIGVQLSTSSDELEVDQSPQGM